MKRKYISVELKSFTRISGKAFKAVFSNDAEYIIPASQIFAQNKEVTEKEEWFISEWILRQKQIPYKGMKAVWLHDCDRNMKEIRIVKKHIPEKIKPVKNNEIPSLKSERR